MWAPSPVHKYRLWSRNENQDAIDDWVTELQDRGGKRGQVRNSKQRDKISVRDIDGASPDMYRGFPQPHTRVPGEHRPARTPRGGWTAAASEDASPNGKLTYPQNMEPPSQWSPSDPSLTKSYSQIRAQIAGHTRVRRQMPESPMGHGSVVAGSTVPHLAGSTVGVSRRRRAARRVALNPLSPDYTQLC